MSNPRLKTLFQVRLRTLLILITLFAGGLAFWIRMVEPYKSQSRAIQEMESNGGQIQFAIAEPAWLGFIVGDEEFKRVVEYRGDNFEIDDDAIAPIVRFPFLERLYLNKTKIGDGGLRHIARLKNLQRLSLWRTNISGDGLKHLAHCQQLKVLDIHETDVADADLAALQRLSNLRQLKLGGPVYGPGLRHIARLPRLNRLDLTRTSVSFDDLRHLAGSPVAYLALAGNLPSSVAEHLAQLPNLHDFGGILVDADDSTATLISRCRNLESVRIVGTEVTDATVTTLVKLPRLKTIDVHGDLTDNSLRIIESSKHLTNVSLAGRFSVDAVIQLVTRRPNLTGTIRMRDRTNEKHIPAKPAGNMTIQSLIRVMPMRYQERLESGVRRARTKMVVTVTWPARLLDLEVDDPNLVETISFVGPDQGIRGYRWTIPTVWSLDGLDRFPNLRQLSTQRVRPSELGRLAEATQLRELTMIDERLSDEELHQAIFPDSLDRLNIMPSRVTPAGFARLQAKYPAVKMHANGHGRIYAGNHWKSSSVGQSSISVIAESPSIETVQLTNIRLPINLDGLARLPNLQRLDLRGYTARESLWPISQPLPRLRELLLSGVGVTDREIERLELFPMLETLDASAASISDDGLKNVAHNPRLRVLRLGTTSYRWQSRTGPWLTGRTLDVLSHCPSLETLNLNGSRVRGKYLSGLSRNTQLKEVLLGGTLVDDEGCEFLSRLPNLVELNLASTNITDTGLLSLSRSPSLRHLDVRFTRVTDSGLRHLESRKNLETVKLRGTEVTEQGYQSLKDALPELRISR